MATPFPFVSGAVLQASQLNAITTLPINDQTASYTLVVGDVGKRVIMNNAGATTITVNNSVFGVGDTIFIANKGAGTCTITAGAGVTINVNGSLALTQYGGGTLVALSASTFTFFPSSGVTWGIATGGTPTTITPGGVSYTLLTFTATGTLTVTRSGIFEFEIISGGGGGSGTFATNRGGGGGGGSNREQGTIYLTANQTITVGGGGAGGATETSGTRGNPSSIGTLVAGIGGGGGMPLKADNTATGRVDGGCGGGGCASTGAVYRTGGLALSINGNNGGDGRNGVGSGDGGGGGGGITAAGSSSTSTTGGAGGAGYDISAFITGSATFVGAGGGGGGTTGGAAGSTGAGAGGSGSAVGANATGRGSGGGGGGTGGNAGGNGFDGAVYIRFRN